jgi:hypothetical protein
MFFICDRAPKFGRNITAVTMAAFTENFIKAYDMIAVSFEAR